MRKAVFTDDGTVQSEQTLRPPFSDGGSPTLRGDVRAAARGGTHLCLTQVSHSLARSV